MNADGCNLGCLYMTAVQLPGPASCRNQWAESSLNNYTSAKLITRTKKSFMWSGTYNNSQPILIESRMRLNTAVAPGMWVAFWGMPENDDFGWWCLSGEIDFMEHNTDLTFHSTLHHGGKVTQSNSNCSSFGDNIKLAQANETAQWHTFSTVWDSRYFRFFMDGKRYHEVRSDKFWSGNSTLPGAPYIVPFNLQLSLSVGGIWPGFKIDPGNHTMYVDYMKVEQLQCTLSEAGLCNDGVDNDCDGYTDGDDKACGGTMG